MPQNIIIKRSVATASPASLAFGELAYSDSSKKLFVGNAANNPFEVADPLAFGITQALATQNQTDIATNASAIALNTAASAQNTTDIATLSNAGVTDAANIATNTANIAANDLDIATLTTNSVSRLETDASGYGFVVDDDAMTADSAVLLPTQQSVKAYVDSEVASAVVGGMVYKGAYDVFGNTPNIASGSALTGDTYTATTAGTFLGETIEVGDMIIAETNGASVIADFSIVNRNVDSSVFSVKADEGAASGIATLDANTEVVQLPAGAAAAEALSAQSILLSDGTWTDTVDGGTF